MTLSALFLFAALICFLIGAINPPWPRPNMVALGLFLWLLSYLVGGHGIR